MKTPYITRSRTQERLLVMFFVPLTIKLTHSPVKYDYRTNRPFIKISVKTRKSVQGKESGTEMGSSAISVSSRNTTDRLCYIFLVFLTGCLAGWIYEEIFYWVTEGMLRNRGLLYGPWLPIYGVGAIAIYAMKPLKKHPLLLFFLCVGVTGVVEYVIGYAGIRYFGLRLWDYRGLFLNLNGIICFRSVMSFGVLGMAFHYILEPFAESIYSRSSPRTIQSVCLVLALLFLIDCILSALFRTPITY